tara:strand:- start:1999 stop:2916 length:918 start_codon:yes stop_codon:yes gene_type:complete
MKIFYIILLLLFILFIIKLITLIMTQRSRITTVKRIEPIIILLDLDKTLIGNIKPQSIEYYIYTKIKEELIILNKPNSFNFDFKKLRRNLKTHIIRPYLDDFLNLIKKYNNIEIYIYTASDDNWAKTIIPQIEKVLNIKFNRPLFTRNHIIEKNKVFKKSMNIIKPIIFKKIKQKYHLDNINQLKNIMLFDDTQNVLLEQKYQINVPSYNYIYQEDFLKNIPLKIIKTYYIIIENIIGLEHSTNVSGFKSKYHRYISKMYENEDLNKNIRENDKYWMNIKNVFKNNIKNTSYDKLLILMKSVKSV